MTDDIISKKLLQKQVMSGCESAKIIQINQDLTEKQSNIDSPFMDHSRSVFFYFFLILPNIVHIHLR